jgi:hypothetical protein
VWWARWLVGDPIIVRQLKVRGWCEAGREPGGVRL